MLRRWLVERWLGREPPAPTYPLGAPPYLQGRASWQGRSHSAPEAFRELKAGLPVRPIVLSLPGGRIELRPGDERTLFGRRFDDLETLLAVHRFAWLPLQGDAADPAWVAALWAAWSNTYGTPIDDWPWHPYTAAERAINILEFGRRHGLPGSIEDTRHSLARHGGHIAERLEYFGERNTSNHLANNGRGLHRIGIALGDSVLADRGARILLAEAERIFGASGVLREGSSHYHLLLTRNYAAAWLAARRAGRAEQAGLEAVTQRALAVARTLALPGRFPLIGDISPDCPPSFLAGLLPAGDLTAGWGSILGEDSRAALLRLRNASGAVDDDALRIDGWLRFDHGPWSGLWHAAPQGWTPMPGHGHQDLGGFELHYCGEVLFCDLGRGGYGESEAARRDVAAAAHNAVTIDDIDPYPPNRPYYSPEFRRRVGGPAPQSARHDDGVSITHDGFCRLGAIGTTRRRWRFDTDSLVIDDRIDGRGRHRILRRLHVPHAVVLEGKSAIIPLRHGRIRLSWGEGVPTTKPVTLWTAYGEGRDATAIEIAVEAELPFADRITAMLA